MKKVLIGLVLLFFLFPVIINAQNYYVDATNGNDANNGLSPNSAWKTITTVNNNIRNNIFKDGDAVLFKRGEIFDDAAFQGTSFRINHFTIADYGSGAKPRFEGNIYQPIFFSGTGSTEDITIRNIDISGQNWMVDWPGHIYERNIYLKGFDGVTIDGVYGNGHIIPPDPSILGHSAIQIDDCIGEIVVKNCELFNWGPWDMPRLTANDQNGIYITNIYRGAHILIHNNILHDFNGDGVAFDLTKGSAEIYNNEFYNFGENAIDLKSTENVDIHHNEFYFTTPNFGRGGNGGPQVFIVIHPQSHPKYGEQGYPSLNNIVRDNYFHDGKDDAIHMDGEYVDMTYPNRFMKGQKIYRNIFENMYCNGMIRNWNADETEIYSNIIINPINNVVIGEQYSDLVKIYNNVIYASGNLQKGINIFNPYTVEVKNNIIYLNDPTGYPFYLEKRDVFLDDGTPYYYETNANLIVDHNNWYNSFSSNRINWDGITYSYSQLSTWINVGHSGELFGEPLFANPANKDFHLLPDSPAIDAGVFVSLTSDFEGNAVPQGAGPDIGAYEYGSSTPPPPVPGDLNNDGVVDIFDLIIVASNFGKTQFDPIADNDNNGVINILDIIFVASRFT